MTPLELRQAQLEDFLRKINLELDLPDSLDAYVKKLLKETPEESFEIYKKYLSSFEIKRSKNRSTLWQLREH